MCNITQRTNKFEIQTTRKRKFPFVCFVIKNELNPQNYKKRTQKSQIYENHKKGWEKYFCKKLAKKTQAKVSRETEITATFLSLTPGTF